MNTMTSLAGCLLASATLMTGAQARTQPVTFNLLTESGTVSTPFQAGDVLRLDTLVTTETGPLNQSITFSLASGVSQFFSEAAWEISTAAGPGPRLIDVNIDLFNSSNVLVASDTFLGTLGGFAHSTFGGAIGPGTYRLVATGTGVRDSSLDVTVAFAVPEPGTYALMLAGLLGLAAVRWRQRGARLAVRPRHSPQA
jgi:PEP-CTERM motif